MWRDAGDRCLRIGLAANVLLVAVKFFGGFKGHSQALVADGLNSMLDVVAGTVSVVGYRWAVRPPDRTHHWGHHNAETLAALLVGLGILATGGVIVRDALVTLSSGAARVPTPWTIWIALAVILTKSCLYLYTRLVAGRTRSPVVSATATDHAADVVATAGVLIGVIGAQFGMPALDPVAAFWVAIVILVNAVRVLRENTSILIGGAPPEHTMKAITDTLSTVPGVKGLHRTKVRSAGRHLLIDTEVLVDGSLTVDAAHEIASLAGDRVLAAHPTVADVVVHIEPHTERRAAEGADPLTPRAHARPRPDHEVSR
ncbi:MAG: cation diffusion facilitator family transporter [Candidatus Zixiibacteriota bacterium]